MIYFLNEAKTTIVPKSYPGVTVSKIDEGVAQTVHDTSYRVGHLYEQTGPAPAGKYLIDRRGAIRYLVDPGIGGRETKGVDGHEVEKLDSPKSQIMALVVDGILTQKLPWGLILIGAFMAIAIEILGVPSLPVAVGVYLPISTSATMFMGGIVRWLVDRRLSAEQRDSAESDSGPGVLFSSGLIAGGAIMGVALAGLAVWEVAGRTVAERISMSKIVGALGENGLVAMVIYVLILSVPLYLVARRGTVER
jgi:hypothetical protein